MSRLRRPDVKGVAFLQAVPLPLLQQPWSWKDTVGSRSRRKQPHSARVSPAAARDPPPVRCTQHLQRRLEPRLLSSTRTGTRPFPAAPQQAPKHPEPVSASLQSQGGRAHSKQHRESRVPGLMSRETLPLSGEKGSRAIAATAVQALLTPPASPRDVRGAQHGGDGAGGSAGSHPCSSCRVSRNSLEPARQRWEPSGKATCWGCTKQDSVPQIHHKQLPQPVLWVICRLPSLMSMRNKPISLGTLSTEDWLLCLPNSSCRRM